MQLELIQRLEKELMKLDHELKIDLPRELNIAAAHGDLSENAEYDAAKERKRLVESRVSTLQKRIGEIKSVNMDAIPKDRVGLGSRVTIESIETEEETTYHFVFPEDVDPEAGRISLASPIGKALVGRREGDEVKIVTPKSSDDFEIIRIRTYHDKN